MRISDWSSDVCSSDLQVERSQVARYRVESNVFRHMGRRPDRRIDDDLLAVVQGETKPEPRQIGRASCRERVWSVRVDLGGRRIIKKKTRYTSTCSQM